MKKKKRDPLKHSDRPLIADWLGWEITPTGGLTHYCRDLSIPGEEISNPSLANYWEQRLSSCPWWDSQNTQPLFALAQKQRLAYLRNPRPKCS